ncbi:MAG: hypothetical protein HY613_08315 [Candidatus Rokubacteria bacterium]|nr:hypothetical protein [Candidatus Rokubacteria bacterium]
MSEVGIGRGRGARATRASAEEARESRASCEEEVDSAEIPEPSLQALSGEVGWPHACDARTVSIGILSGFTSSGASTVQFGRDSRFLRRFLAQSIVPLSEEDLGRSVAILWDRGDRTRPVIIGLIEDASTIERVGYGDSGRKWERSGTWELAVDRLTLVGREEIRLRCGEASITLTRDGRITIRGANVLSRSSGLNRIKGAAVQIN